jgi:GT2 family glycosyltransferase
VFSIDDDAWFSDPNIVQQAIEEFDVCPQVAAFALRYTEPECNEFMDNLPHGESVRSYIGCSHAVRTRIALNLGGYREFFVHQGEERDLCLRIWAAGSEIRFLRTPPIVHEPSNKRNNDRWDAFGIRNTFLFEILNTPMRFLPLRLLSNLVLLSCHSIKRRGICLSVRWIWKGMIDCVGYWPKRDAVGKQSYIRYRKLPSAGPSCVLIEKTSSSSTTA